MDLAEGAYEVVDIRVSGLAARPVGFVLCRPHFFPPADFAGQQYSLFGFTVIPERALTACKRPVLLRFLSSVSFRQFRFFVES